MVSGPDGGLSDVERDGLKDQKLPVHRKEVREVLVLCRLMQPHAEVAFHIEIVGNDMIFWATEDRCQARRLEKAERIVVGVAVEEMGAG